MIQTALSQVALPQSGGGLFITGLQVMLTFANYSSETNQETRAKYSKFAADGLDRFTGKAIETTKSDAPKEMMVPSRVGMSIIYMPALIATTSLYALSGMSSFFPTPSPAEIMVIAHFLKRMLEVLFLHKYSGQVAVSLSSGIGIFYALSSILISCVANPNPSESAMIIGYGLFAVGLLGNFYHHYILATLRGSGSESDNKKYVAPRGGLFNYVAAPHYFFELIGWLGIAVVAQQLNAFLVFTSMTSYLSGRAVNQNMWNRKKFEADEWPESRKNLVPFLF